jgi:hypothetical protein
MSVLCTRPAHFGLDSQYGIVQENHRPCSCEITRDHHISDGLYQNICHGGALVVHGTHVGLLYDDLTRSWRLFQRLRKISKGRSVLLTRLLGGHGIIGNELKKGIISSQSRMMENAAAAKSAGTSPVCGDNRQPWQVRCRMPRESPTLHLDRSRYSD